MGPISMIALAIVLTVVHIVVVTRIYDRVRRRFGRPRTVDLPPGMYHFRDGKVEDGGLEWRPVVELFR